MEDETDRVDGSINRRDVIDDLRVTIQSLSLTRDVFLSFIHLALTGIKWCHLVAIFTRVIDLHVLAISVVLRFFWLERPSVFYATHQFVFR